MKCVGLAGVLALSVLVVGCSTPYRYDYQKTQAVSPSQELIEEARVAFNDRYRVPKSSNFTHQAPFAPNPKDHIVVPRPVPLHNLVATPATSLRQRDYQIRELAEIHPDGRGQMSLRVDVPGAIASQNLEALLVEQQATFYKDAHTDEVDKYHRADCAFVFVINAPVTQMLCIYTTLQSSYVVSLLDQADNQAAAEYGKALLDSLYARLMS